MNRPTRRKFVIQRILVAMDPSEHGRAAAEAAIELAASLHAELLGLFVEDINLIRLADLGVSKTHVSVLPPRDQIDTDAMRRALRAQAERIRRQLQESASRARIKCSFRTVCGAVVEELLSAARETDLLVVGKVGQRWGRAVALGSTAKAAAASDRTVLLVHRGVRPSKRFTVIYDDSETSRHALEAAAELRRGVTNSKLHVVVVSESREEAARLRLAVTEYLSKVGVGASFGWLRHLRPRTLKQSLEMIGDSMILLGADLAILQQPEIQDVLGRIESPILLVR